MLLGEGTADELGELDGSPDEAPPPIGPSAEVIVHPLGTWNPIGSGVIRGTGWYVSTDVFTTSAGAIVNG